MKIKHRKNYCNILHCVLSLLGTTLFSLVLVKALAHFIIHSTCCVIKASANEPLHFLPIFGHLSNRCGQTRAVYNHPVSILSPHSHNRSSISARLVLLAKNQLPGLLYFPTFQLVGLINENDDAIRQEVGCAHLSQGVYARVPDCPWKHAAARRKPNRVKPSERARVLVVQRRTFPSETMALPGEPCMLHIDVFYTHARASITPRDNYNSKQTKTAASASCIKSGRFLCD